MYLGLGLRLPYGDGIEELNQTLHSYSSMCSFLFSFLLLIFHLFIWRKNANIKNNKRKFIKLNLKTGISFQFKRLKIQLLLVFPFLKIISIYWITIFLLTYFELSGMHAVCNSCWNVSFYFHTMLAFLVLSSFFSPFAVWNAVKEVLLT